MGDNGDLGIDTTSESYEVSLSTFDTGPSFIKCVVFVLKRPYITSFGPFVSLTHLRYPYSGSSFIWF